MDEPIKIIDKDAVEKTLKATDLLSVSIASVNQNGIITTEEVGHTDASLTTEVEPNTAYKAASLSKPVFAYLVLELIAANHNLNKKGPLELGQFNQPFDLDTPLYEILPIEGLSEEPSQIAKAKKLTARMILSQRSGLPITHQAENGPLKFDFEPNTEYGYSGVGFAYLQKVIDRLTQSDEYDIPLIVIKVTPTLEMLIEQNITPPVLIQLQGKNENEFSYYLFDLSAEQKPQLTELDTSREYLKLYNINNAITYISEIERAFKFEALVKKYVFDPIQMNNSTFIGDKSKPLATQAANSLQTTSTDYAKFSSTCMQNKDSQVFDPARTTRKQVLTMINDDWGTQLGVSEDHLKHVTWSLVWGLELDDHGKPIRAYHTGDMSEWRAFVAMDLEKNTAIVYFAKSKHQKENVNGFILADQIITPNVELKHALPYFSQKFAFPVKYEDNWQDKEKAQFERVVKYVKGCDIYLMSTFPQNLEEYLNRYILLYDKKELVYIHSNMKVEAVKVDDFTRLSDYIDSINPNHDEMIHLSSRELRKATTSKDDYTGLPHLKLDSELVDKSLQNWKGEEIDSKWKELQKNHIEEPVEIQQQKTEISTIPQIFSPLSTKLTPNKKQA